MKSPDSLTLAQVEAAYRLRGNRPWMARLTGRYAETAQQEQICRKRRVSGV
jgi:hypothetical protein